MESFLSLSPYERTHYMMHEELGGKHLDYREFLVAGDRTNKRGCGRCAARSRRRLHPQQTTSWLRLRPRWTRSCLRPEAASTADEVVPQVASMADEVVAEAASTADEIVAKAASTANAVVTEAASTADRSKIVFFQCSRHSDFLLLKNNLHKNVFALYCARVSRFSRVGLSTGSSLCALVTDALCECWKAT